MTDVAESGMFDRGVTTDAENVVANGAVASIHADQPCIDFSTTNQKAIRS